MKLYATVTSERASKGQGGEWLEIKILDESQKEIASVHVDKGKVHFMYPELSSDYKYTLSSHRIEKGERQKGECAHGKDAVCARCAEFAII